MGLLEKVFPKNNKAAIQSSEYFKTFTGYSPVFQSYNGSLYEMDLIRSAIHTHATFSAKLKPTVTGSAYKELSKVLQFKPNPFMDTYKFIYRVRTILETENTAFIIPILNDSMDITGYYPVLPSRCEVKVFEGTEYLVYTFSNGQRAAIEFFRVGILNKYQYQSDFFGEDNNALRPTADLINTQNQGIIEGIKSSATIRFIGRLNNTYKEKDLSELRKGFKESNLSSDNNGGIVLADNRFSELKQVDSKAYQVDAKQMELIQDNVFTYFNTNKSIIQNTYNEDQWNAYYEGAIEPFAIQLSIVLTNMTYTQKEIACGNEIFFSANRLQYASNSTKLSIVTQLFDRGFITTNEGLEIFNMPSVENGDERFIRKEYANVNDIGKEDITENDN